MTEVFFMDFEGVDTVFDSPISSPTQEPLSPEYVIVAESVPKKKKSLKRKISHDSNPNKKKKVSRRSKDTKELRQKSFLNQSMNEISGVCLKNLSPTDNSDYIQQLEKKVSDLANQNEMLRKTNTSLTGELSTVKEIVKNSAFLKFFILGLRYLVQKLQLKKEVKSEMQATGVIFLVIFLCFGIFFQNDKKFVQKMDLAMNQINYLESKKYLTENVIEGNLLENVVEFTNEQDCSGIKESYQSNELFTYDYDTLNVTDTPMIQSYPSCEVSNPVPITHFEYQSTEAMYVDYSAYMQTGNQYNYGCDPMQYQTMTQSIPQGVIQKYPQIDQWETNTSYMLCNDVQMLSPPEGVVPYDNNSPMTMKFYIPPDSEDMNGDSPMLEVTCKVVDVKSVPVLM